ncbi:MAG: hypothetical protein Q9162_005147 [Coniocarpon cinnabarinum]
MVKPDIIFVPGFWEGPKAYDSCAEIIRKAGYTTHLAALASTGKPFSQDPKSPGLHDDVAAVRSVIEPVVQSGRQVVLVLHSASGFLGSHAIEHLSRSSRVKKHQSGGVTHIVFITAAVFPEGFKHGPLPFFEIDGPRLWCVSPRTLLFNDVESDKQAQRYIDTLQCQPSDGWDDTIHFCGWREVPSSYLICEKDQCLPVEMQEQFAKAAGSKRIERCNAGHMATSTSPEEVAKFIKQAASEVSTEQGN